ncbi:1302_t:CDS:2 [Funneliformis caledonium]|uniref:1302_t:CDS:1 n=1 Tax=Funneliformis caledonium TaxID=1117310 RepID=A0A9N9FVB0_9GLOM|nr:1302_t:CDS:2 [Funneliformis caledonium]
MISHYSNTLNFSNASVSQNILFCKEDRFNTLLLEIKLTVSNY